MTTTRRNQPKPLKAAPLPDLKTVSLAHLKATKDVLVAHMRNTHVSIVIIRYSGKGGTISLDSCASQNADHQAVDLETFAIPSHNYSDLGHFARGFAFDVIAHFLPTFEKDLGGAGSITVDAASANATLDHLQRTIREERSNGSF